MEDDFILDMSKTYIYQGDEYNLTGRSAEKGPEPASPIQPTRVQRSTRRKRRLRPTNESSGPDIKVEITPTTRKPSIGSVVTTNLLKELQWVRISDLYVDRKSVV